MERWRLLDTGNSTAEENMAIDEALMLSHAKGISLPTIRFYGWSPSAISLGYSQKVEEEIDAAACLGSGVHVVKRITGGRAVLHENELTYSLVASENNQKISGGITESYLKIAGGLQLGLRKLGAEVEMANRPLHNSDKTAACFDAPSWYELTWQEKKVTGSAQTRRNNIILQHGSVPLSMDAPKLFSLLKILDERLRAGFTESFKQKACGLDQVLKRKVTYVEVRDALIVGMQENLNINLIPGVLSDEEKAFAKQLMQMKKYANELII